MLPDEPALAVPRKPGPEPRFLHREIIDVAMTLIDEAGLAAFSMRVLAARLGLATMGLYKYFRTRDELLEAVRATVVDGLVRLDDMSLAWDALLMEFAQVFRKNLTTHPGLVDLLIASLPGPALDPAREYLLNGLRRQGFDRHGAVAAVTIVPSYVLGFAVARRAQPTTDQESRRIAALPAGTLPYLHDAAEEYAHHLVDENFEEGLGDLIAGIGARYHGTDRGIGRPGEAGSDD
jgi:AcrR family transcriptional regulator